MAPAGIAGGSVLSLRRLAFGHAGTPVFTGLSAEIGPGVTWLVGDEGSGKTTLLELVAGVLRPAAGSVAVDGIELSAAGPRPVAWCDAGDAAHDASTVEAFVGGLREQAPAFDAAAFERHVDGFGLRPHLGKSMFQLSTGTRRKVGLAAVFAMAARVTLLDDPAAALDGPSLAHLARTLASLDDARSGACLVAVYTVPAGGPDARALALPPRG